MVRRFMGKRLPDGWYKKDVAPNGVYILTIDDYLVERRVWNVINNPKAVGVAILSDYCKFAIPRDIKSESIRWGNQWTPAGATIATDMAIASKDYRGKANTDAILQVDTYGVSAAYYCNSFILNGRNCYLGSLGEWVEAYKNVNEVNLCIQIINGNPMYWGGSWSSTIYDFDTAWSFHWGKGEMGRNLRKDNVNVCPFAPL